MPEENVTRDLELVRSVFCVVDAYATSYGGRLGPVVGDKGGLEKVCGFRWSECVTFRWNGEWDVPPGEGGDKPRCGSEAG